MKKRVWKVLVLCVAVAACTLFAGKRAYADVEAIIDLSGYLQDYLDFEGYEEYEDDEYEYYDRYDEDYDWDGTMSERDKATDILDRALSEADQELNSKQRIYDLYGKFSEKEIEKLTTVIKEQEEKGDISIRVFVIAMSANYEKYLLEECADRLCDAEYASEDLALMLLNLGPNDRGVCIQGYGLCEERINDDRIEYILDDVIEFFMKEKWVAGIDLFAKSAGYYATSTDYNTYFKDNSFSGKMYRMPWFVLVMAPAAVAVLGIALMSSSSGGGMTAGAKNYIRNGNSGLNANNDTFLRTDVKRTYSPVSSSSSGGRSGGRSSGGGGRSGGGRSHSGGSRRF